MRDTIPMGVLAPKPKEPPKQPPSEATLRMLVENDSVDIAQAYIEQFKLPYKIDNGKLMDLLVGTDLWLKKFITKDPDTIELLNDVRKLAKCDDEVLITGETGTGKELIAQSMIGDRKGDFVVINCGGLPENLIESELFGHLRGAFTGAESTKKGMMQEAQDGVFFMDEIGELPLHTQAKLLRALETRMIRKVGGNLEEAINCKFVCATHRNLRDMVSKGTFRQDLYARISTFELHIKPLHERDCDVEAILLSMKGGKEFLTAIKERGIGLHKFDLSNNVRSLKQHVKRFAVLGKMLYEE